MELWEEVESSVRANQPNTRADEQQHDSLRGRDLRDVPASECLVEFLGGVEHGSVGEGAVDCV